MSTPPILHGLRAVPTPPRTPCLALEHASFVFYKLELLRKKVWFFLIELFNQTYKLKYYMVCFFLNIRVTCSQKMCFWCCGRLFLHLILAMACAFALRERK